MKIQDCKVLKDGRAQLSGEFFFNNFNILSFGRFQIQCEKQLASGENSKVITL